MSDRDHPDGVALDVVLTRTLNRAAHAAPPPPPDLHRTVARRHARRRGTLVAAAAAVTVFAVLTGAVGALRAWRDTPAPTTPATAEERWPDAVRTVPSTLDGVRPLSVNAVLPDGRTIASTPGSGGTAQLVILSDDSESVETIVEYPQTSSASVHISQVRANSRWVVWQLSRGTGPEEIWSARLDAPHLQKIATVSNTLGTFSLTLDGDRVIYGPTPEGIRIIPAVGGTPTLLPGTDQYFTVFWPWLVHNQEAPHHPAGTPTTLWNTRTGERRTAVFTATSFRDSCSPVWCVALGHDGMHVTTVRVDGTDRRSWPEHRTDFASLTPIRDRYLPLFRKTLAPDGTQVLDLIDLVENRTVELGRVRNAPSVLMGVTLGDRVVSWPGETGFQHVLDLKRVR
ncbi:hypothetical protein [Cryptosporangium aurantiacum]|uniref:Uncharacterized protein n=1 Tax=Cryptosporangium aurantiacum TaxID=134849 RepID=A0A1M7RHX3_9ACTN|nr:hypothetical protein [Cryptosporangium aurantiacum]SHN45816.1 hypothetical protein SAMN05443668_1139 [Cryptosporangium aurantiacum]